MTSSGGVTSSGRVASGGGVASGGVSEGAIAGREVPFPGRR